ncbi:MAG: right-handed parallel beta-helix repeat-containing protein, partial [Gammaproteobacteria bacterium]|nr:right-handed parallel beta-helix repeat-containing protein [Gammaproteobacteria bacterium]
DAGGSGEVLHLSSVSDITIEHLVFQNYAANGINIDDSGNWPAGASTNITLRDIVVRNDIAPGSNNDGIKLSGVDGFHIDRVQVSNWGTGGSAIDPVGCHNGVIENSTFSHAALSSGSGVRPKGGSADIRILANLVALNAGRAIQAGGSTGTPFFRFPPGESDYEAARIVAAGNIIVGGQSAVSWVNIDGGEFRYNAIAQPDRWVMRMLNENVGTAIVETQNGSFADNIVVFDNGLSRISNNDGPGVLEETFSFARNTWYNADSGGPAGASALQLPAAETDGLYGVDPQLDPGAAQRIATPWGLWIVNPHLAGATVPIPEPATLSLATPGVGAAFDPLAANPLSGSWSFTPAPPNQAIAAQSQAVLMLTELIDDGTDPVAVPAVSGLLAAMMTALLASAAWLARRVQR